MSLRIVNKMIWWECNRWIVLLVRHQSEILSINECKVMKSKAQYKSLKSVKTNTMALKAPWLSPVKRGSWERRQVPKILTIRSLKIMCELPERKSRVQRRMAISRKKNRKRNLCPGPGNSPSSTSKKLSRQHGYKLNYSKRSIHSMRRLYTMLNLHL